MRRKLRVRVRVRVRVKVRVRVRVRVGLRVRLGSGVGVGSGLGVERAYPAWQLARVGLARPPASGVALLRILSQLRLSLLRLCFCHGEQSTARLARDGAIAAQAHACPPCGRGCSSGAASVVSRGTMYSSRSCAVHTTRHRLVGLACSSEAEPGAEAAAPGCHVPPCERARRSEASPPTVGHSQCISSLVKILTLNASLPL